MASTGTATGPQKADGTVQQPEAAAGVDSQHSGAQFRQEGASLSETGQAAGIKGSGSTAAELGLLNDVDDGSGSELACTKIQRSQPCARLQSWILGMIQ